MPHQETLPTGHLGFKNTWPATAQHLLPWSLQVAVVLRTFGVRVPRVHFLAGAIVCEKDAPTCPLHASPSIHSWETICGETVAEFCTNSCKFGQKAAQMLVHFSENCANVCAFSIAAQQQKLTEKC